MVSDLVSSPVRRELHCTQSCTGRLSQEPARGLPEGPEDNGPFYWVWSFLNLPLAGPVHTVCKHHPLVGSSPSAADESTCSLVPSMGPSLSGRRWVALPGAKPGSEVTCEDSRAQLTCLKSGQPVSWAVTGCPRHRPCFPRARSPPTDSAARPVAELSYTHSLASSIFLMCPR